MLLTSSSRDGSIISDAERTILYDSVEDLYALTSC